MASPVRFLRACARNWPEMRAVSPQWPRWVMRQLLMPVHRMPLTLTSRTGVRCRFEDDPVDDLVFRHVHGWESGLYFPPAPIDAAGIVLDVGAHHGIYAIEALRRYPGSTAIAIEPDPDACRRIEVNAALNGVSSRIEIVQAGLAQADGSGWLEASPEGSWGNRTRAHESALDPRAARTKVPMRTLNAVLRGRRPSIVKCNAEGAEFALVPQLVALGLTPRVIVLMIHPEAGTPDNLIDLLGHAGYHIRDADSPPKGYRFHVCSHPTIADGTASKRRV